MRFCIPYESTKDIINDFNTRGANSSDIKEEESERHIEGYEKYPYIDDFLIEANNSIENELNRLYEKVQQEEIENKERFNNLFGGLI